MKERISLRGRGQPQHCGRFVSRQPLPKARPPDRLTIVERLRGPGYSPNPARSVESSLGSPRVAADRTPRSAERSLRHTRYSARAGVGSDLHVRAPMTAYGHEDRGASHSRLAVRRTVHV